MDKIQELEGPVEQNELAITKTQLQDMSIKLGGVENDLEAANKIIEDHKRHLKEANEQIKDIGSDLNNAEQRLGTAQNKLKETELALTEAEAKSKLEMTNAETEWKLAMTQAEAKWQLKMTQAERKWELEKTQAEESLKLQMTQAEESLKLQMTKADRNWEDAMTMAKRNSEDAMTTAKKNWEADKERLEKALEKMDVSLAAKNMDGLSWLLFSVKFTLEATLAGLEFGANKDSGMKFLIASIVIAFLALILNGWEVVRRCKEKKVCVNYKIKWSRVPWLPEIYSFVIILLELAFYVLKLWISKPVHVSPYTCMLHICILVQKLTFRQKLKAARARRDVV